MDAVRQVAGEGLYQERFFRSGAKLRKDGVWRAGEGHLQERCPGFLGYEPQHHCLRKVTPSPKHVRQKRLKTVRVEDIITAINSLPYHHPRERRAKQRGCV